MTSSLPTNLDIQLKQGDDFIRTIQFNNPDGSAFDLTGYNFSGFIQLTPNLIINFTINCIDIVNGLISISIPSITTTMILPGFYDWDFSWIASELKQSIFSGNVEVQ